MRALSGHIISCLFLCLVQRTRCRECEAGDYNFVYTECHDDQRWKVAVPKSSGLCTGGTPPAPVLGRNCSFSCPPGHFLNLETQECAMCPAGKYSIGGGVRFEELSKLPEGMQIRNVPTAAMKGREGGGGGCPAEGGWRLEKGWLSYYPTPCWSILSYSAKLVKSGLVEAVYKVPESSASSLLFQMEVQNEQCESYRDRYQQLLNSQRVKERGTSGAAQGWQIDKLRLRKGQNVITWRASNTVMSLSRESSEKSDAVVLYRIDVTGLPYTMKCTDCPAGTYSSSGSATCSPCKADTYSTGNAATCLPCDTRTQYAEPGSRECKTKPACTERDYYAVHGVCNGAGTHNVSYKWIQPHVCRNDTPSSVQTPPDQPGQPCPQCNPGMFKINGQCEFCPKGTFSDGNHKCMACNASTIPNTGMEIVRWDNLPRSLTSSCEVWSENEAFRDCDINETWLPAGDRLHTAHIRRPSMTVSFA